MRQIIAVAFVLALAPVASAATVEAISGQALINRGGGYEEVRERTEAAAGDLVMVRPEGLARIVYAQGCAEDVRPGAVVPVMREPVCKSEQPERPQSPTVGQAAAAAGLTAAAAGIALAVGSGGGSGKPISP